MPQKRKVGIALEKPRKRKRNYVDLWPIHRAVKTPRAMAALVYGQSIETLSRIHDNWAVGVADVDTGTSTVGWRHVPDTESALHRDIILLRDETDIVVAFVVANRCDGKWTETDANGLDVYIYTTRYPIWMLGMYGPQPGRAAPTLMHRRFDLSTLLLETVARLAVSDHLNEPFPDETPMTLEITNAVETRGSVVPCPVQVMRQVFGEVWKYGNHDMVGCVVSIDTDGFWKSKIAGILIKDRLFYKTGKLFSVPVTRFPILAAIKTECNRLRIELGPVLKDALRYGPRTDIATHLAKLHSAVVRKTTIITAGGSISLSNAPPCVMAAINSGFKNERRWKLAAIVIAVSRLVKMSPAGLRDEISTAIRESANPNDRVRTWELSVANALGSGPIRPFPCRLIPGRKKHPNNFFCPHRDTSPSRNAAACISSRTLKPGAKLDPSRVTVRDIMVYTTK
jgi:hypothetical protein